MAWNSQIVLGVDIVACESKLMEEAEKEAGSQERVLLLKGSPGPLPGPFSLEAHSLCQALAVSTSSSCVLLLLSTVNEVPSCLPHSRSVFGSRCEAVEVWLLHARHSTGLGLPQLQPQCPMPDGIPLALITVSPLLCCYALFFLFMCSAFKAGAKCWPTRHSRGAHGWPTWRRRSECSLRPIDTAT